MLVLKRVRIARPSKVTGRTLIMSGKVKKEKE